jgi:hypothetical protein
MATPNRIVNLLRSKADRLTRESRAYDPLLKRVRPAMPDSYEALFHETGLPEFLLTLRDDAQLTRCRTALGPAAAGHRSDLPP